MKDDAYAAIAKALISSAPVGWQKIIVYSSVEETVSKSMFDFINTDGKQTWFDPDSLTVAVVGRNFRDIRDSMTMPGQEPWSRCTFTLFPDGKFKFDVEYDD